MLFMEADRAVLSLGEVLKVFVKFTPTTAFHQLVTISAGSSEETPSCTLAGALAASRSASQTCIRTQWRAPRQPRKSAASGFIPAMVRGQSLAPRLRRLKPGQNADQVGIILSFVFRVVLVVADHSQAPRLAYQWVLWKLRRVRVAAERMMFVECDFA